MLGSVLRWRRRRWRNRTGNQSCRPRSIETPSSSADLVGLVRRAELEHTTVRAVGSGHAWSDVALTEGFLLDPSSMGGMLELDDGCLRPPHQGERLVRVLAGTRVRELNAALDAGGLALANMGGYDGQTIAGVVSTSTHGSGLRFGPFPDVVRSIDMVVAGGAVVRIEPGDGPTDPEAYRRGHGAGRRLTQDDRVFAAAVCGIGCMGVMHSLVLRVRDKFWLNEIRELSTWEEVRESLTEQGVLGAHPHYELLLNPYPKKDGRHRVLVTTRTPCPEPAHLPPDKLERNPLTEMVASFPLTGLVLRVYLNLFPCTIPRRFDALLRDMRDDGYASVSYRVFNIGAANKLPAYSCELGVPLKDGRHVEAIERVLATARAWRRKGVYHTCPIALRFVAPSKAYASMMHDRATMMIELILVYPTRGGHRLLAAHERALADLGVRPHWGQYNELGATTDLRALYERWDDWLDVYARFNASGVFNSPFTERIGISRGQ